MHLRRQVVDRTPRAILQLQGKSRNVPVARESWGAESEDAGLGIGGVDAPDKEILVHPARAEGRVVLIGATLAWAASR